MHIITVYMSEEEWSIQTVEGMGIMEYIALKTLRDHREIATRLVVEVIEHAGWYLSFAIHQDRLIVVGTANDTARYSDDARAWHTAHKTKNWRHIPTVLREGKTAHIDEYPHL